MKNKTAMKLIKIKGSATDEDNYTIATGIAMTKTKKNVVKKMNMA